MKCRTCVDCEYIHEVFCVLEILKFDCKFAASPENFECTLFYAATFINFTNSRADSQLLIGVG